MIEHSPQRSKKAKKGKKKSSPVYVEVRYPVWLGAASLAWTVVGWGIAALAPHLAHVPMIGVLHYAFPAVTVVLIAANLFLAVRDMLRGAHVLRLMVVTGLQIGLFTTLFFQLYAHVGASLYDADGPTSFWQWLVFSLAHAFRAADVVDSIEAFGAHVQPVKHTSSAVAVFVVAYHVVVDVFFLRLLWTGVNRVREQLLEDEGIRNLVRLAAAGLFGLWAVAWMVWALIVRPWAMVDVPLWFAENVLRVVDFADVMESFNLRMHQVPREGVNGVLTVLCRVWIGLTITWLFARRRKVRPRTVLTPPDADALPYWLRRVGALAGVAGAVLAVGVVCQVAVGNPTKSLAASVGGPSSEQRSKDALRALRRMGPSAGDAVPRLVEVHREAPPELRDEITRTLGYLGSKALNPLAEIAAGDDGSPAAVEALGRVGPAAAPALARVWAAAPSEEVRDAAAAQLRRHGDDAMPALMAATTPENADTHYHWFRELDRNWQVRGTPNRTARALQGLPDNLRRVEGGASDEELAAAYAEIASCGTAAKRAVPSAVRHLHSNHNGVSTGSRAIVSAAGPDATLQIIHAMKGQYLEASDPRIPLLADPRMWDRTVLADEAAVPVLLTLLTRHDQHGVSVGETILFAAVEGAGGPDTRPLVPVLVGLLGHRDQAKRDRVRDALAKADPDWRKHPDLCTAIPALLPKLPYLPADEAKELLAILGELRPGPESAVVAAIKSTPPYVLREPGEESGDYRKRTDEQNKLLDAGHYAKIQEAIKAFGPRLRADVPAIMKYLEDTNSSENAYHKLIAVEYLPLVADPAQTAVAQVRYRGQDVNAIKESVKKLGPAAIPGLVELLDGTNPTHRHAAVLLLGEFGPAAKQAVPKAVKVLLDKDWATTPAATEVFNTLANAIDTDDGSARDALLAVGPPAKAHLPKLIRSMFVTKLKPGDTYAVGAEKALDRIDPKWRDSPATAAAVETHLAYFVKHPGGSGVEVLTAFGTAAVPGLTRIVKENNDPYTWRAAASRLATIGGPAAPAIPALLEKLAADDSSYDHVLKTVGRIDREWAAKPEVQKAVPKLLGEMQSKGPYPYIEVVKAFGTDAVPTLILHAGSEKTEHRVQAAAALKALGPTAKDALPTLAKLLQDKESGVWREAFEAISKVGVGQKEIAGDLIALFVHQDNGYFYSRVPATLDTVDPDWRKHPKFKPILAKLLTQLSDKDERIRWTTMYKLKEIGPAEGVIPALEKSLKQDKGNAAVAESVLKTFREAAVPKPKGK